MQNEGWWEVNWSQDLWVGFGALVLRPLIRHLERTDARWGTSYSYDEVDVLYHNMCWNIMLFVPHQHSAMRQDVTPLSSAMLLLGRIFQSILIILWPGIQFMLQYCRWVWTGIDLKGDNSSPLGNKLLFSHHNIQNTPYLNLWDA